MDLTAQPCLSACCHCPVGANRWALRKTWRGTDFLLIKWLALYSNPFPAGNTTLYPQSYVDALVRWANEHKVLLAVDEVQSGMGRTGRMFAFEHYGIAPDLIACGKGLSSSVPASAVIGRLEIMDLAVAGEMSSTFEGNPISAAAVLVNLDVLR